MEHSNGLFAIAKLLVCCEYESSFFLFFWDDCERRGWYDSSQSALRPHCDYESKIWIFSFFSGFSKKNKKN